MTEPNEMSDSIMRELNNVVIADTDETKEKEESFSFHEEQDLDDIPPSLLRYFETSKSRAAVCEKLILEEPADFITSHHTEDMMNLPIELNEDMMKLKEQVICDSENEENNTSSDTRLLPAPTATEALFTNNVSVCPSNNEDEAGTDEYMESEKHFAFEMRTLEMSLNEEEQKKMNDYKAERQKQYCAEEDRKRQIEGDFQMELKKIMEAETLHQMELELMEKRAQEKLEQEFVLQQELISNLQRRVEEERKMREEEQKRMKEEQDKRKREEEKIKIEAERKRTEDEEKIKREAERKRVEEEEKIKREAERKRMEEEEKIKREAERKRMEEEEKIKREAERKRMEEEKKIKREAERERMEEEAKIKRDMERKRMEEETVKKKEEERKIEEIKLKKQDRKNKDEEKRRMEREEKRKQEENKYQMDLVKKRLEDEMRMMNEGEEEERKKREEEESGDKKEMAQENMYEDVRKRDKKECGNVDEEMKLEERKKKEDKERKKIEKTPRPTEEHEKRKRGDETKAKEEEQRRRQKEKLSRHKEEEDYRKSEEDMRLKEDKEGYKNYDVDRKMERESKTKDKEEKGNRKEERNHVEAEKTQNKEEVGENKTEVNNKTEEEITLKKPEVTVIRANQVQEKNEKIEHNSTIGQNEKNNMDKKERCLASQLEDGPSWASASPTPLHSESTIYPPSTEAMIPQHDLDTNIRQTTINKTTDYENQGARGSAVSVSLPMCLPEHTEQKRLTWMKDCIPWSKLSLQNRRKREGSVQSRRRARRAAEAGSLPPLCPDTLLQATGWKTLQQVTTVTLEDLPGCNLSTLAQCTQLQSLSLRRCGLKSLEGINQLPHLCYIDVQENDISFVDCENMTSLRVLQLSHNKLTSIHGLAGAENLDVLDLSHNSITRIAGLESMRRLQRLSVDHNQLISIKGLRDVYTLLHLNCSHNHLASVEGLENSALLNTLDLRANSLTEPPSLNNQVLLRELHLDDNSISSLQSLTTYWLPLMQHLSVAQNRITHLPSMSDFVSLANLDLRFNCMSELQNVCESLDGCQFLREVHLTGNPLQQESGWRSTLQKAVPGLTAINEQETDSTLMPPAVQQVSLAPGSFLKFCQAQLQQICDLQQQHSRELSNASFSLDAVQTCRHFTEALKLAEDQRFAHEYGDTTVADQHRPAGRTTPEEALDLHDSNAEKHADRPGMESTGKVPSVIPNKDNIRCSSCTLDEKSAAESLHANLEVASESNHQDLDVQNTAAVVIQQLWRKYREKCGNISSPSTAEKGGGRGGDGIEPESRPSYINGSVVGKDYAATVIQAFWRGFTLRRRLASALAAVTCPDTGEDDTFEEVDVDEFVFDEAALEKTWILPLSEDPPCRHYPVSEQPSSLEAFGPFPEPSQYIFPPSLVQRPKQAWVAREQVDSAGQRVSSVSSNRSKSPASNSEVSGLSKRSEKILEEWGFTNSHTALLMLKRAQNMKSKKQQQKKQRDPSARLALFRNCSYQLGPVEARNRQAWKNRTDRKVREAELGLQREEKTERVKQEQAQQWLHTQTAHSDRDSESMRFLPEISSDILNGGRVQLVAEPGYTERLHHASGLWANSSLAAQPCKENSYPRRNSFGHAREEIPAPQRVTSAPTKKERISFRDNPVQLSGGWGGGKKRGKVHK